MRIDGIETMVVFAPRRLVHGRVPTTALGTDSHSEHGLVFVHTDVGITGVGEIASVFSRRGGVLCRDVDEILAPCLTGEDPFRITYLLTKMDAVLHGSEPAKAGLEMALFDIVGKALDTPVYNLIGGMVRERIPLSFSIPFGTPQEMAAYGAERAREGFRTVKVKVGQSHEADVEAVRLVREAVGPAHRVRVDANMAWRTAKQAARTIRAMAPYDPELIEQPVPARELETLAEIRRRVDVPIMVDESVWTPRDAIEVIRRDAADVVNVYVVESGGILNAKRTIDLCETAGIPCLIGSMPELGIGTAAQMHLGVAVSNLAYDSDCCGSRYFAADLLTEPLDIEGGYARPPTGPGLGVEVDMDVVRGWAQPGAPD